MEILRVYLKSREGHEINKGFGRNLVPPPNSPCVLWGKGTTSAKKNVTATNLCVFTLGIKVIIKSQSCCDAKKTRYPNKAR